MSLRKIAPRRRWSWNGPPRPKLTRNQELGRFLVRLANARAGFRVQAGDPIVITAQERGFIKVERRGSYGWPGRLGPTSHTHATITEDGWTAVWTENLGAARPVPKSERIEKRARHGRRRFHA